MTECQAEIERLRRANKRLRAAVLWHDEQAVKMAGIRAAEYDALLDEIEEARCGDAVAAC